MTSEFCADNVLVQLTSQQVFSEPTSSTSAQCTSGRVQTSVSVAVELGRRLLLAARAGQTATVLELMAKGAPFTTDWLGTSPLHLAAANNHVETCAVLLRAGVSRDARTKVERTPLHMAAHAGNVAVISLLINHGASIDCRDMLSMTPLHWAAARGHEAAARELLRAGADAALRCKFRKTPRDLALRNHHDALVTLLDTFALEEIEKVPEDPQSEFTILQSPKFTRNVGRNSPRKEKAIEMEIKPEIGQEAKAGSSGGGGEAGEAGEAAALLRRHGITLLPADPGGTLLTALQSGRTVVLSDAGKLLLKESTVPSPLAARSPARPLKVMALNNKIVVNDSPKQFQHVKLVQLGDGKLSAAKLVSGKKPVKIVLNKEHFQKLVSVSKPSTSAASKVTIKTESDADPLTSSAHALPAESKCSNCAALRAQLADARAQLAALRAQLRRADTHSA